MTYTDGTTSTFTQNFSDWAIPQNYTGETTVAQMANRVSPNGQTQTINMYVFGYTFALTAGKTPVSVKSPSNRNVVFLAAGLAGSVTPTAATPGLTASGDVHRRAVGNFVGYHTGRHSLHHQRNDAHSVLTGVQHCHTGDRHDHHRGDRGGPGLCEQRRCGRRIHHQPSDGSCSDLQPNAGELPFLRHRNVGRFDNRRGHSLHHQRHHPNGESAVYSSPITVTTTTTFEAIAVAPGFNNSPVTTGTYTITYPTAAAPNFNPPAGSYVTSVTVRCPTPHPAR